MKYWQYFNPVEILFGNGCRRLLIQNIKQKKLLIITSKRGRQQIQDDEMLCEILKDNYLIDSVTSNPELDFIKKELNNIKNLKFDALIAFGGGSSIDTAKAISSCINLNGLNLDIENILKEPSKYLERNLLPIYALPTTSGTGSEVTQFSTIWDKKKKQKLSISHKNLFPKLAIIDPELTYSVPFSTTLSTGLDALNQSFESIWNKNKTPISSYLASKAIGNIMESLPRLINNIDDFEARYLMAEASLLSGLCISQTFTAICHSISYPLTLNYGIEHGVACAFTMVAVAKKVLEKNSDCFQEVISYNNIHNPQILIDNIENLLELIQVRQKTKEILKTKNNLLAMCNQMITPSRCKNFILDLSNEFLIEILNESYK